MVSAAGIASSETIGEIDQFIIIIGILALGLLVVSALANIAAYMETEYSTGWTSGALQHIEAAEPTNKQITAGLLKQYAYRVDELQSHVEETKDRFFIGQSTLFIGVLFLAAVAFELVFEFIDIPELVELVLSFLFGFVLAIMAILLLGSISKYRT